MQGNTPPASKPTLNQVLTHLGTLLLSAVATYAATRPATPPATPPAQTPPPAPTAPQVGQDRDKTPAPAVYRVAVLRIEAAKVELVGNVNVAIPEIKLPSPAPLPEVVVENTLPAEVREALLRPHPAPVVTVVVPPAKAAAVALPEPGAVVVEPEPGKVEPTTTPTATPAPVRVWPKQTEAPRGPR